ncbi:MAG: methyl-accepting chemotaxis protein [Dissulfurispiraceae bacterium]|jgi:methyl-accepting chemotaxis protein
MQFSVHIRNLSLRWKVIVPAVIAVTAGILITVLVTTYATRDIVINEAQTTTMQGYRETVLNALTSMMMSGSIRDTKRSFIDQMKHVSEVRVIRAAAVNRDWGEGDTGEQPVDNFDKDALRGKESVVLNGESIRGVFPYIAKSNYNGTNCLSCHHVPEGTVLGAVSITVPLKDSFIRISHMRSLYFALGIMGTLSVAVLLYFIVGTALKPLTRLERTVRAMTDGDLSITTGIEGNDEIGRLARSFDAMVLSLRAMVKDIVQIAGVVVETSDLLRENAEKTVANAVEQSGQSNQVAVAAEQMSKTVTDIAQNAGAAADMSTAAMLDAEAGEAAMSEAIGKIGKVHAATIKLSSMVDTMNTQAIEIGAILAVIKDIADQTNLLALNAAIEAAHAGEHGRGFAVVADEVRKLAEKTKTAAGEITAKISLVRSEASETAKAMSVTADEVSESHIFIKTVSDALEHIVASVQKSKDQVTQIAAAVEEQSAAAEEIAGNITKTSGMATGIEKMAHNILSEISRMVRTAESLRNETSRFTTTSDARDLSILDVAKTDHRVFVGKVGACLHGDCSVDAEKMPDHRNCRLGKWYYNGGRAICGTSKNFRDIEAPHEEIHLIAKKVVEAVKSGDKEKAARLYKEMEGVSHQIVSLLDGLKKEYSNN